MLLLAIVSSGQDTTEIKKIDYIAMAQSVYLQNLDSALHYLYKGVDYYKGKKFNEEYIDCLNGIGTCLYYKGEYHGALEYFDQAIDKTEKLLGKDHASYSNSLNNLSRLQSDIGEYNNAIKNYRRAVQIEKEHGKLEGLIIIYNNLGESFEKQGDIQEAILYYKKALSIQRNLPNSKMINYATCYHHLASAFLKLNDLKAAFDSQEKALQYYKKSESSEGEFVRNRTMNSYWNLVEISLKLKNDTAIDIYSKKAVHLEKKYLLMLSSRALSTLGEIELKKNNIPSAIHYFQRKLTNQKKQYLGFEKHSELGRTYAQLADAYFESSEYFRSLDYYHQALFHMTKDFKSSNIFEHPVFESINKDQDVLKILFFRAQAFCELAKDSNRNKSLHLDAAEQTFDLALQLINHLRKDLHSLDSKVSLGEMANLIYKQAVKCNYIQYQLQPTSEQLEKIFQIVESGKAAILLESINENMTKGFAGIPDSLIAKDNQLKKEISNYQELLYNLENADKRNQFQIDYLEDKLFDVKNTHTDFLTYLEAHYPNYYNLKYDQRLVSLDQVKDQLPDSHSAIIEYFMGEDDLYIICFTKERARITSVGLDIDLKKEVQNLRQLLRQPPRHEKVKEDFVDFERSAHYLYSKLIAPIDIPESIDRLIIIPDDVLGYVPFEIFLQELSHLDQPSYNVVHLNYLLNDYSVSYNYSVTLWGQESISSKGKGYLGIAPNFEISNNDDLALRDSTQEVLYHLKCNEEEVSSVAKTISGLTLKGNTATKEKILKCATDYQILHFATHSSIDDENPMLNKIFLYDDYLSNYDLYNIRLKADLAVLSACNTGNGKLLSGEGIMSIFRGFLHAGCPSSLISLWSVEDCSTQAIVQDYFIGLSHGQSKDQALQYAKKNFVSNADRLHAHPFYWAAFVQYGSIDPITFKKRPSLFGSSNLFLIALFILAIVLGFWFIKKGKV